MNEMDKDKAAGGNGEKEALSRQKQGRLLKISQAMAAVSAMTLFTGAGLLGQVVEPNVAFWAPKIEYHPGEVLLLRARLPGVKGQRLKSYELRVELPAALPERELQLNALDAQGGFLMRPEERRREVKGGRQILIFRPATERYLGMKVVPGATYTFSCLAKGEGIVGKGFEISGYFRDGQAHPIRWYPTYITFDQGTYDWKPFKVELKAPRQAAHLILLAIKWQERATYGTLYVDDLSLFCEREPGKNLMLARDLERAAGMRAWPGVASLRPVLAPRPGRPKNLALRLAGTKEQVGRQAGCWLPMPVEPTHVTFDRPWSLPTLALDVPADFRGDHTIRWSVAADGNAALEGAVPLVPAPQTAAPKRIESTIWLAESSFETLPHPIQHMYLQRLKRLGLNGIMPTIREPNCATPLEDTDCANWTAQWARRNGMQVRCYLHFLYSRAAREYCEAHPQYWAETWIGKKTPDYRVCLTHAVDGGKYDDNKTGALGGRKNPWLGRLCEAVRRSVAINDLQGVWWDFEIAGVPIRKERPKPYDPLGHRQVCTCLRCRRAFADYAKLDHLPSVKEIMSDQYYERWNTFKCWQHTRVWALMRSAARQANPRADFRIYSGTPHPYSRQAYGVDWTMAASVIDVAMSVHTWANSERLARSHYAASEAGGRRNPLVMSVMINGYDMSEHIGCWRNRQWLGNQMMQSVIDWDCLGVALTGVWGFDSQFNAPVREANAVFARYEELLTTGKHDDKLLAVEPASAQYAVWRSADAEQLVGFFFNNTPRPLELSITKPHAWPQVVSRDAVTESREGIGLTVPAWDRGIVEFAK